VKKLKINEQITKHWSRMQASGDGLAGYVFLFSNRPIACYYSQGLASDNLALDNEK
jgi:hypothetical protein